MTRHTPTSLTRRGLLLTTAAAGALLPHAALAATHTEITWDDLIPAGLPYPEIIGEGDLDEVADTWAPIFDANAFKLNEDLDGAEIKMPGYIIPLDVEGDAMTSFMLVPYIGACIHTPPPPPNQLVFVETEEPWPLEQIWDAIWVYGRMTARLQDTELGETGYEIAAERIEIYEW
ncbi:DUF3299 domain-containing protein [Roseobacter sp. HKCCA0434]|uniref:DUF3299 domain-containing protein n=1 Tax=Roseobacter sp. HKCCA0434 TaxID=3079297 RepID=UPI002905CAC5|nr:DUF3299 domain-containing protein [Roseobacter sp. HKCCA0434]